MTPQEKARHLRHLIVKASASLSDEDALEAVELFDQWESGKEYHTDKRLRYDGRLFRVRQTHTSQEQYQPSINTAALYEEVTLPGDGDTPDKPIAYNGNMALENGKYYTQDGIVYVCTRDTVNPVYNNLADLVGIYVEQYNS